MLWQRVSQWHEVSDAGYTVSATRCAAGWKYAAWGPDRAPAGWSYRDWRDGRVPHWAGAAGEQFHFARGEQIPQRFELLGCRDTAAEARALCEAHAFMPLDTQFCESRN